MAVISGWLLTELLGAAFVVFAGAYIYFRYFLYNYWRQKGVVYVEPTIPTGNLTGVVTGKISIGELYADAYAEQKNNRYFGMYAFYKPSLVLADPELVKFVLTKEFGHFHDRGMYCNEEIDPLSAHLFFLPGSKWRNLRAKLTPTFTSGKMRQMFATVVECGDQMTKYLKPRAEKREVIEMKDLFARFGTDVIMSTAFGISCNSIENPESEFRHWGRKAFESIPIRNSLAMFAPKILDFLSIPMTNKGVTKFFSKAFKETLEYRRANNVTRPDFMNLLVQLINRGYVDGDHGEETPSIADGMDGKITTMEGAAQAYVFFLAGFETTSSTITYCLYELASNQEIQDKVAKDINAALKKHGGLTYESLMDMPYLKKVVAETLRKYPPLPLLNRVCTKDVDLPTTDLHLKKGLDIVIPTLGIQRDPEIYPDPEKFDPERFDEENIASRHPYTYLPFGEGPRICIGKRFGYAQSKVGLISILSKYRVRLGPNTPLRLDMDPGNLVLATKCGIELLVEPRSDSEE